MSAQPVDYSEDSRDPAVILARLPERARPFFLDEYEAAVDAAHEVAGYRQLQQLLQSWSVRAVAYSRPGFFEGAAEAAEGRGECVTMEAVIARYEQSRG